MRNKVRLVSSFLVLAACAGVAQRSLTESLDSHPDDIYWAEGYFFPGGARGVDARVLTEYNGMAVVAGSIEYAGPFGATGIVGWDGVNWQDFGTGPQGDILTLSEFNEQLIAGGAFLLADSQPVNYIAAWDGTAWSALGSGLNAGALTLCEYGGQLIVGGGFTVAGETSANRIAAWDGTNWTALGSGLNGTVVDMTVYQDRLVVCGGFTEAGDDVANHIACWDGANWFPLAEFDQSLYLSNLAVVGDSLFAASFDTLYLWDGSHWSQEQLPYRWIFDLESHDGQLIIASYSSCVYKWDGVSLTEYGTGLRGFAHKLYDGQGGLYAAGHFLSPENKFSWIQAKLEDSIWRHPVGNGANENVLSLTQYDGNLVAGGRLTAAGGIELNQIGAWDGSTWYDLDSVRAIAWQVVEVAEYENQLIAAGVFHGFGGPYDHTVGAWDGHNWTRLGTADGFIGAFAEYNGNLIAGGNIQHIDGLPVGHIAAWNGNNWSSLGSGCNGPVAALAVYDGKLIAGGYFDSAGGVPAHGIASWDGHSWSPLASGVTSTDIGFSFVLAVAVYNRILIAGGYFNRAGNQAAGSIAAWDGSRWFSLGSGVGREGSVSTFTVYDGRLFAGGRFDSVGGVLANNIALWDGSVWQQLGSGVSQSFISTGFPAAVPTLKEYQGSLYVGGDFIFAGEKISTCLAQWTKHYPYGRTVNDPDDLYALQAFGLEPVVGTIYMAYYSDQYTASDIDQSTVVVNGVSPLSLQMIGSYPDLDGEVLAVEIDLRELLRGFGTLWGTSFQQYTVTGEFTDGSEFSVLGSIRVRAHIRGDVDGDGSTNVGDVAYLVNYLFADGIAPEPLSQADIDCDEQVTVADLANLVAYLFQHGPEPQVCP